MVMTTAHYKEFLLTFNRYHVSYTKFKRILMKFLLSFYNIATWHVLPLKFTLFKVVKTPINELMESDTFFQVTHPRKNTVSVTESRKVEYSSGRKAVNKVSISFS